ncbi:MAG: hypothetical protein H6721_25390 [Sandaracinus sp.]|nr:hypothetical protein [Sandaracinus sp.]
MRGWVSAIVVLAAIGCGAGDLRELDTWELRIDGHSPRGQLPARLDVDRETPATCSRRRSKCPPKHSS